MLPGPQSSAASCACMSPPPRIIVCSWALLAVAAVQQPAAAPAPPCEIAVTLAEPSADDGRAVQRSRAVGVLNGVSPNTPDEKISQLGAYMFRVPAPSPFVPRLQALGVESVQLILGPQILEERVMK